jgi:hypothetical protein
MGRLLTQSEFISKAIVIHGDKYDYSKIVYINRRSKVELFCNKHQKYFWQKADAFLLGQCGCPECNYKKYTSDEIIKKFKKIHNNKYIYDKFVYDGIKIKSLIGCPIHGYFLQTPDSHIQGQGCLKCGGKEKLSINEFIDRSNLVHNNKYNYDKFVYANIHNKSIIVCPIHGDFLQKPINHLNGHGCLKCGINNIKDGLKSNIEEFINKANIKHNFKFDYSEFIYKRSCNKGYIICPVHGKFQQTPNNHLVSLGCPKCTGKQKLTTIEFIQKAKKIHNDKYNYYKVDYINIFTKVCIVCLIHGEFWQTPDAHLRKQGCPTCSSSQGNLEVEKYLKFNNIKYISEYKFDNCQYKRKLSFDFYLQDLNVCIEFDGGQHSKASNFGSKKISKEDMFDLIQHRDIIKNKYCIDNNIKLIRIPYWNFNKIEDVLSGELKCQ